MKEDEKPGDATHNDILEAVNKLREEVGYVETDMLGQLVGKGLVARVARLETRVIEKFNWIDTLKKQAMTAAAVIAAAAVVIWWLASQDVERVFRDPPAVEKAK
jgi:hypothetical protein